MPVQKVIKNGKTWYRWGNSGKLYPTKEQSFAQGKAIMANQAKQKKK